MSIGFVLVRRPLPSVDNLRKSVGCIVWSLLTVVETLSLFIYIYIYIYLFIYLFATVFRYVPKCVYTLLPNTIIRDVSKCVSGIA